MYRKYKIDIARNRLVEQVDLIFNKVEESKRSGSIDNVIDIMCSSPGIGKTYATEKVAIKYADRDIKTIFAMPTNDRVVEEVDNVMSRFQYEAGLIRGRHENNCQEYAKVKRFYKLGYYPAVTVCNTCEYRDKCHESGYYAQFQQVEQPIVFMPYESVVEQWGKVARDVVVFDEDPSRMLLEKFDLNDALLRGVGGLSDAVETYVQGLRQLLVQSQSDRDIKHLRGRSLIALWCDEVYPMVTGLASVNLPEVAEIIRNSSNWSEKLESEDVKRPAPPWLADIAMSLDRDIKRYYVSKAEFNSEMFLHNGLLTYRRKRKIDLDAKLVVLDAYAQPKLYEDLLERKVNPIRCDVEANWQVTGIERNTSKGKLKEWNDQDYQWFWSKLLDVMEYEKMVVYCHDDFKEQIEEAIQSCHPEGKVKVDHVFQGRGSNEYKDFDTVVIFGSCYLNMNKIGDELRAFSIDDPEPVSLDFQDGCYTDPRVNQHVKAKQLGEIVQCVHRIRPVLADAPKQIILVMSPNVLGDEDDDNEYDLCHHIQVDHWQHKELWSKLHLQAFRESKAHQSILRNVISTCVEKYGFFHHLMVQTIQPSWQNILGDVLTQLAEMNHELLSIYGGRLNDNKRFRKDVQQICQNLGVLESWLSVGHKRFKVYGDRDKAKCFQKKYPSILH